MSFEGQDIDSCAGEEEGHRKRDTSRKRDGKKDKKEKGYTMFEEEDSEENLVAAEDFKSPSKTKKDRVKTSFKFPVRKEKVREKEEKKDKEARKEGKRKEEKEGKKLKKEKKKSKHVHHDAAVCAPDPSQYENPIFGVPLAVAVERNKSHDGIELPAIFRECVDYIEECGLTCEGIYRISGVKSKVQALKDSYNRHQQIFLYEHEPNIVASLLKQFLRDLPEPVLTPTLMPKFEEASTAKSNKKKVELFTKLIADLPTCNRLLLSWMIVHMSHVIDLAKENKMTLQNVSIVLSPTMKISHRVLNVLFTNAHGLFGNIELRKYVPPLRPAHSKWSLELPDNQIALEEELAKQESLLNQLHADLNSGLTDPVIEEQLWEVQRVVTQLKRKIKLAKKSAEAGERRRCQQESKRLSNSSLPSLSAPEELHLQLRNAPEPGSVTSSTTVVGSRTSGKASQTKDQTVTVESSKTVKFASDGDNKVNNTEEMEVAASKIKGGANHEGSDDEKKQKISESTHDEGLKVKGSDERTSDKSEEICVEKEEKINDHQGTELSKKENDTVSVEKRSIKLDESPLVIKPPEEESKVEEVIDESRQSPSIVKDDKHDLDQATNEPNEVSEERLPDENAASQPTVENDPNIAEITEKSHTDETTPTIVPDEKPVPPFMSFMLLEPVKAEIPKPNKTTQDNEEDRESQLKSVELRELEEELLGEKKEKMEAAVIAEEDDVVFEDIDDAELEQLLEEEYALIMEEEELRAIEDELRQKIDTECSEMERLTQEIQELQYLRQDSDLEDWSSDSNSSEESEDEEDLQDLLSQVIKENEDLEMQSADLCQKIHEERMICLTVKLQIRLLQQKQLETSCA